VDPSLPRLEVALYKRCRPPDDLLGLGSGFRCGFGLGSLVKFDSSSCGDWVETEE
jgi:hypothetical protein